MDGEFLFVMMGRIYSGFIKGSAKNARIMMFRRVVAGKQSTAPVQQYGSSITGDSKYFSTLWYS
jgi:hypothetical protein